MSKLSPDNKTETLIEGKKTISKSIKSLFKIPLNIAKDWISKLSP